MLVSINIALVSKINKDSIVLSNISARLEYDQLSGFAKPSDCIIFTPSYKTIFAAFRI